MRGRCALLRRRSWMARCEYSSALGWLALNAAGADGLTSSPSAAFAAVPSAHATISQSTCITRSAGLVRDGELPWCVPQAERPISLAESISIVRQASNARRHRRARTNEPTDGRALDLTLGAQHECDVPQPVRRLDVCLHCPSSHRAQPVVRPDSPAGTRESGEATAAAQRGTSVRDCNVHGCSSVTGAAGRKQTNKKL